MYRLYRVWYRDISESAQSKKFTYVYAESALKAEEKFLFRNPGRVVSSAIWIKDAPCLTESGVL